MNIKMPSLILLFLTLFMHTFSVMSASFDCDMATTITEHAICRNQKLNALDDLLGEEYRRARKFRDNLKNEQIAWINFRNKACLNDEGCLIESTRSRIDKLVEYSTSESKEINRSPECLSDNCAEKVNLNIPSQHKIFGYKDLKFGMTRSQCNDSVIINNGVVLFGESREVACIFDEYDSLSTVVIRFGGFDKKLFKKIKILLSKKYDESLFPTKKEITEFDISYSRELSWEFEDGQVSLVIYREIDVVGLLVGQGLTFAPMLALMYKNNELAAARLKEIFELKKIRNTKTTTNDL